MRNSKKTRRWRGLMRSQFLNSDELECLVSDRVAIVYLGSPPVEWAVYGYPAPQGRQITSGKAETEIEAKRAARKALDAMVGAVDYFKDMKWEPPEL